MKTYEAMCVLLPEAEAKDRGVSFVREKLQSHGAEIHKEESMGIRKLAYPIRDYTQANYFYFVAAMKPQEVAALTAEVKPAPELLRFLLVKT